MNMKLKSILEMPLNVFAIIMLVLFIIPILIPMGLPLNISNSVKQYYDVINKLPPGSIVMLQNGLQMSALPEFEAADVVCLKILFEKARDLKIIIWCGNIDGPSITNRLLRKANVEKTGRVYGTDYVLFGYAPSTEAGLTALAKSFRDMYPTDYFGTPTDAIPMMKNIFSIKDITLYIHLGGAPNVDILSRQLYVPYKTRIISNLEPGGLPRILPFYPTVVTAYIDGTSGAAELEVLTHYPGLGSTMNDATNLVVIGFVSLLFIGNISLFKKDIIKTIRGAE